MTMLSVLDKVEAKGIVLGRNEGITFGEATLRFEAARRMWVLTFTAEQIAQVTDLSLDEIETLRAETFPRGQPTA